MSPNANGITPQLAPECCGGLQVCGRFVVMSLRARRSQPNRHIGARRGRQTRAGQLGFQSSESWTTRLHLKLIENVWCRSRRESVANVIDVWRRVALPRWSGSGQDSARGDAVSEIDTRGRLRQ